MAPPCRATWGGVGDGGGVASAPRRAVVFGGAPPRAECASVSWDWREPPGRGRDAGAARQSLLIVLSACATSWSTGLALARQFQIKFVAEAERANSLIIDPRGSCRNLAGTARCFSRTSHSKDGHLDTSIMDPDPPRPDERPDGELQLRPEGAAPPPPANSEDVSPTLAGLKNGRRAARHWDWAP